MATTITRETLLEKAKPRYAEVDVPGFGVIGLRSTTVLQMSHRSSRLFDDDGKIIQKQVDLRQVHTLMDQVMVDENTPMFTGEDADSLSGLDPATLAPLMSAIREFNGEADETPEKKDESADSSES